MSTKRIVAIVIAVLISGCLSSLIAQGTAFTYQGRLKSGGAAANGSYDFEFRLYDALGGGAQLGPLQTAANVTVTDGTFSVNLDFGNQFPGPARFLDVTVRQSGGGPYTPLAPRQAILSTPYAIKSLNADLATNSSQLGGLASTSFVQQDGGGNVSIGGNLTVNGSASYNIVNAATQFNLGGQRILSSPSGSNLFAGFQAGQFNTGFSNSFFGNSAGASNLNGNFNSFFGASAGQANSSGSTNSFFGNASGGANTTGSANSFFGDTSGLSNTTGYDNAFFGRGSGNANTTGFENSFFGKSSGLRNTTGSDNSFFGINAGINNTTARFNTFIGTAAGSNNSTGEFNTFVGNYSGLNNTVNGNAFFGASSGLSNTVGVENTFIGTNSGASNDTGNNNTFVGRQTGVANVSGSDNTFVGRNAGLNTSTSYNSFFGSAAGQANSTGFRNAFFGNISGQNNTTGFRNAFFGNETGSSTTSGSLNSFFGDGSGNSNTIGGNNSFFGQCAGCFNLTGSFNSFFGQRAGINNTTGGNNLFMGYASGDVNVSGTNNTLMGYQANVGTANLTNATAIGANAIVSQSDAVVVGNNANVGIGTSTPGSKLTVVGLIETKSGGVKFPDGTTQTTAALPLPANLVNTVNNLSGNVTQAAGTNITITPAGNTLTLAASGGVDPSQVILNRTIVQAAANFNIDGTGRANILHAATQFNLAGQRIVGNPGQNNLFIGIGAGAVTPSLGDNNLENTFVGTSAGQSNTDCCNAFFGNYAGQSNTTGGGNTFVGYQAGKTNVGGSNNTFVGINTGTSFTGGNGNTFVGNIAGNLVTTGTNNTFLGQNANVAFGSPALSFATAIGAGSVVSTSNTVVVGKAAIGAFPADTVQIPGNLVVTGTFTNPSDARLKQNIHGIRYGLDEVLRLRPVSWHWKTQPNGKPLLGMIAQEVEPIMPELVEHSADPAQPLTMNYIGFLPVIVKAMQEQQSEITRQKAVLDAQQKQIETLKKLVCLQTPEAAICNEP